MSNENVLHSKEVASSDQESTDMGTEKYGVNRSSRLLKPRVTFVTDDFKPHLSFKPLYIAVSGNICATDCSVFGLLETDAQLIIKKFPVKEDLVTGVLVNGTALEVLKAMSTIGYNVVDSTGKSIITWTLKKVNL